MPVPGGGRQALSGDGQLGVGVGWGGRWWRRGPRGDHAKVLPPTWMCAVLRGGTRMGRSSLRSPFRWRRCAAVVGSLGAVVSEMEDLTTDHQLCRWRVGDGYPRVGVTVYADGLPGLVTAVRPVLGPLTGPRVLQGPRGGRVVPAAVEAADEALAVDTFDAEVLQVLSAYDHVDVSAAVPSVPAHGRPAAVAGVPADGRDPQQGPYGEVSGAALDVETALTVGGLSRDVGHQTPAQQPVRCLVVNEFCFCHAENSWARDGRGPSGYRPSRPGRTRVAARGRQVGAPAGSADHVRP